MDNFDPNNIKAIADAVPQSTKEKLFNPAADAIGQGVGGMFTWIFQKPIEFGIIKKAEFADLANKAAEKLDQIPVENRDDTKFGLTIKTLEQSKYSINDELLRDWFSTLVANSVDNRKNSKFSPYFPTILASMTHEDAIFLKHFVNNRGIYPYYTIKRSNSAGAGLDIVTGLTDWNWQNSAPSDVEHVESTVSLFNSFGIIDLNLSSGLASDEAKKALKNIEDDVDNLIMKFAGPIKSMGLPSETFSTVSVANHVMSLTALGKSFINLVIPEQSFNI